MSFGKQAAERKVYSDVLTSLSTEAEDQGININFATVEVKGTATVEPLGYPVIYSAAAANFVPYIAQDIQAADAVGSPLPAGRRVALVVGDYRGVGFNTADITLEATGTKLTALHGGSAGILNSGVAWNVGTNADDQAEFLAELEVQGLTVVKESADITVKYI
jgi:hypothetical protein